MWPADTQCALMKVQVCCCPPSLGRVGFTPWWACHNRFGRTLPGVSRLNTKTAASADVCVCLCLWLRNLPWPPPTLSSQSTTQNQPGVWIWYFMIFSDCYGSYCILHYFLVLYTAPRSFLFLTSFVFTLALNEGGEYPAPHAFSHQSPTLSPLQGSIRNSRNP